MGDWEGRTIEHTYQHKKLLGPNDGEFGEVTLRFELAFEGHGHDFALQPHQVVSPPPPEVQELHNIIEQTVLTALIDGPFPDVAVTLLDYRWLDVAHPKRGIEIAAGNCVAEALEMLARSVNSSK